MFVENLEIKEEQIYEKLRNLNPTKSPGPDKLFQRVLIEISEQLAGPLTILFNKSIQHPNIKKKIHSRKHPSRRLETGRNHSHFLKGQPDKYEQLPVTGQYH